MANTLTYDPTPADEPELSAEEQDSLQRGEELAEAQSEMLAGKFQSPEELEKAYIELQKKLGSNEPEEEAEVEETEEEEVETPAAQSLITDASAEWAEKGELSPETFEKFNEMSSRDLVDAYMAMNAERPQAAAPPDLTEGEVNSIKNYVGGEQEYTQLMEWSANNLDEATIKGFDDVVTNGNPQAIKLALKGLMAEYENENGYEGRMLTGKAAKAEVGFRSQAEVVEAMSDPRYDRDEAYRADVFAKLERSNLNY